MARMLLSTLCVLSVCSLAFAQTGGPGNPQRFADCGILGPGPQGCILLFTDEGQSYAVQNTGSFLPNARVWVEGDLVQQSNLCFPLSLPGILNNTIGLCFEDCGRIEPGPQGCPVLVLTNNQTFFLENTGPFGFNETVWVQGCLNPDSLICPPFTSPGIEDNRIGRCFEGCGRLFQGIECVLFQADSGGVYQLEFLGGFAPGDRVEVRGCLNPNCVSFCFPPDGCIEDNLIRPCADCVPAPDGFSCVPQACSPIPEARCTPVCATLDLSSGALAITQCDCLLPTQCQVDINVATFPRCVGACPPGTICVETRTFITDDIVEVCCQCRPCVCPGDMNGDGILNGLDIQGFINCLLSQPTPTNVCACADVNADGFISVADIPEFVVLLLDKMPCPPRGACCLDVDDGPLAFDTCFVTTPNNCASLGGFYQGDDSTCNIQACCLSNGYCQDADPQCCIASGGIPLGEGTSCATGAACPPIGACCLDIDDGPLTYDACVITTQPQCISQGGVFQGIGSVCESRACCLPNGFCQDADPRCCEASGGRPLNVSCSAVPQCPPIGACCFDATGDGIPESCAVVTLQECQGLKGSFQGSGTQCLGTGACCFGITGGGCVVVDQICCDDILGTFKGLGTICLGDGNNNGRDDACENPGAP